LLDVPGPRRRGDDNRGNVQGFHGLFLIVVLTFFSPLSLALSLSNQLDNHPSPYLALHGKDPVNWQKWDAGILEKARRLNRLVFISSGYFSCHWCHVMQRESFSDSEIAAFLNDHFIPVRIDRELHPALDAYLIDFVRQTQGNAGWPLQVFLTPDGYPLYGLTYAAPKDFQALLKRVSEIWSEQGEKAARLAREATEFQVESLVPSTVPEPVDKARVNRALLEQALAVADEFEGGFGRQNRFPMAPQLLALLDLVEQSASQQLSDFLVITLDQMQNRGLRDHVNGGFFRYTVDPAWSEPHFEKMLYTQALLAEVYLRAAVVLNRPAYRQVARDTIDFVLRHMSSGQVHGFVSSYSAVDDKNHEGGGYLWTQDELASLLDNRELQIVNSYWSLTDTPRFAMGDLPIISRSIEDIAGQYQLKPNQVESVIRAASAKMASRHKISRMPVDHKVLTSWNALFLSTLSRAARQLGDPGYQQAAKKLKKSLLKHAWNGTVLKRSLNLGETDGNAGLEDYVYMARALNDYAVLVHPSDEWQEDWSMANLFAAKAWLKFYHSSGWKTASENLLPGMTGKQALPDDALPAADAMLMELSLFSENEGLRKKAETAAGRMFGTVSRSALQYATHARWINQL
jgi:uncharacterized protein YyaL (SSP411 family)